MLRRLPDQRRDEAVRASARLRHGSESGGDAVAPERGAPACLIPWRRRGSHRAASATRSRRSAASAAAPSRAASASSSASARRACASTPASSARAHRSFGGWSATSSAARRGIASAAAWPPDAAAEATAGTTARSIDRRAPASRCSSSAPASVTRRSARCAPAARRSTGSQLATAARHGSATRASVACRRLARHSLPGRSVSREQGSLHHRARQANQRSYDQRSERFAPARDDRVFERPILHRRHGLDERRRIRGAARSASRDRGRRRIQSLRSRTSLFVPVKPAPRRFRARLHQERHAHRERRVTGA